MNTDPYPPFDAANDDPDYTFIGADTAAAYRKAQTQPPQKAGRAQPDPLPEVEVVKRSHRRKSGLGGRRIA